MKGIRAIEGKAPPFSCTLFLGQRGTTSKRTVAIRNGHLSSSRALSDRIPPPSARPRIGLLIVADARLYRDALAEALAREETIHVLGTGADMEEAVSRGGSASPDVIALDMAMANSTGLMRALVYKAPESKVLALAASETEEEMIDCVEAGAAGYLSRATSLPEMIEAVRRIAEGEVLCSSRMSGALFRRVRAQANGRVLNCSVERITPREREILALIDKGLSNKEIALRLCIEPATVKNHVHNVLEKLGARRRSEAAAAVRGLVPTG